MAGIEEPDYIIVGAGSAGCVLAYRLGEDPGVRVLVLEVGGWDLDPLIHIPLGLGKMHERRMYDWGYDFEPDANLSGRSIESMRGKVVGGSSSINHMSHVRGNRGDYERWAARGLTNWSYRHVLPYFKRCESWEGGADTYRGAGGPLTVVSAKIDDPIFDAYIAAAASLGLPYTDDINGARQEGVGRRQSTIRRGRRHSGATAYLRPAIKRKNVRLVTKAHVLRVTLEHGRAVGVAYLHGGKVHEVRASREVILAGGAYNTPQLLMVSGIGPADELRRHGIAPLLDHAAVGGNFQDHLAVMTAAKRRSPSTFRREMRYDRMALNMVRAQLFGTGPAAGLPGGLHGSLKTEPGLGAPDIQLMFSGISGDPHLWFPGIRKPYGDRCGVRSILIHPKSRGRVSLRSADPLAKVRIDGGFFTDDSDIKTLRTGVRFARRILQHEALAAFRAEETSPGEAINSDREIDTWIRKTAVTAHHPCGTCAMGAGNDAVLDGELRVRGVDNLRVVDASAMPDLVSGNINACVVMLAEKASDHIRERSLAPATDV